MLVLILTVAAGALAYYSTYQPDDAYIVYRYASNLAQGKGFVFNEGARVEGVTCFLWTLCLVPVAAMGLPLPVVAPLLTGIAGLAVLASLPGVLVRLRSRDDASAWDLVAPVLVLVHPGFLCWSVAALETVPYALVLTLALRDHFHEREKGSGWRSALWMGLGTLLRPEAPLIAGVLAFDRLTWDRSRRPIARLRSTVGWLARVTAFFVPLLVFRRLYFGYWLPNTYYAKSGDDWSDTLAVAWQYVRHFLSSFAPGFGADAPWTRIVGGGVLLLLLGYGLARSRLRVVALLVAATGIAILVEGGDWMPEYRFWVPVLPFLAVLATETAREVGALGRWAGLAAGAVLLVMSTSWVTAAIRARDGVNGLAIQADGYRHAHLAIGRMLRERGRPGDEVALMDVGMIGFESGLRVFDITGLTEPLVAHSPGGFLNKQYPVAAILGRKPRFFVLVDFATDARIARHPDFQSHYGLVFQRNHRFNWTPPQAYILRVYERIERDRFR